VQHLRVDRLSAVPSHVGRGAFRCQVFVGKQHRTLRKLCAGSGEGRGQVLDHQYIVPVGIEVGLAFGEFGARLHNGEVKRWMHRQEFGGVLLTDCQHVCMCACYQQICHIDCVGLREVRRVTSVGIEVVELDRVVSVVSTSREPTRFNRCDASAFGGR
jgi:hypothetical protein